MQYFSPEVILKLEEGRGDILWHLFNSARTHLIEYNSGQSITLLKSTVITWLNQRHRQSAGSNGVESFIKNAVPWVQYWICTLPVMGSLNRSIHRPIFFEERTQWSDRLISFVGFTCSWWTSNRSRLMNSLIGWQLPSSESAALKSSARTSTPCGTKSRITRWLFLVV